MTPRTSKWGPDLRMPIVAAEMAGSHVKTLANFVRLCGAFSNLWSLCEASPDFAGLGQSTLLRSLIVFDGLRQAHKRA
jgi:hypothetical protein